MNRSVATRSLYGAFMVIEPSPTGALNLGHVFAIAGAEDLTKILVIRHTYTKDGITDAAAVTPAKLIAYTSSQSTNPRTFPADPPPLWVTFLTDGGLRSRFLTAYECRGELTGQLTEASRIFDLRPSDFLLELQGRLVIEWSRGPRWQNTAVKAASLPVLEIADPQKIPFEGFDKVLLPFGELAALVSESRYSQWQTALSVIQGIYLITDASTGKHYVGKADGKEGIFGRWRAYAGDGHGGNLSLMELDGLDPTHRAHFMFSILRVFGPEVPTKDVNAAETHYKDALRSRVPFGYNKN
jgi:hypothetical protein